MKSTVIYTVEVTDIKDITEANRLKEEHMETLAKAFRDTLDADDVVITKVQVFEGTEGGHE